MTLQSSGSMTAAQIASELRTSVPITISGSSSNVVNWLGERNGSSITIPTHLYSKSAVKLVDTVVNTGNGTFYSFAGVTLGPAFTGRRIIVCTYVWATGAVALDVTSVTISGDSMAGADHGEFEAGGPTAGAGVFSRNFESGTTATITVNFDGTANGGAIAVLSAANAPAIDVNEGRTGTGSGVSSATFNIDAPSNGLIVAAVCRGNTGGLTWSNGSTTLTELVDQTVDSNFRIGCAFVNRLSSGTKNIGFSSSGTVATGFSAQSIGD
jgi:hypothetical protein